MSDFKYVPPDQRRGERRRQPPAIPLNRARLAKIHRAFVNVCWLVIGVVLGRLL